MSRSGLLGLSLALALFAAPALADTDPVTGAASVPGQPELNLHGVIDFHVHTSPDSMARSIDSDDLARLAKQMGMRGLVLKNHFETTAAQAYLDTAAPPAAQMFDQLYAK